MKCYQHLLIDWWKKWKRRELSTRLSTLQTKKPKGYRNILCYTRRNHNIYHYDTIDILFISDIMLCMGTMQIKCSVKSLYIGRRK